MHTAADTTIKNMYFMTVFSSEQETTNMMKNKTKNDWKQNDWLLNMYLKIIKMTTNNNLTITTDIIWSVER